MSNKNIEIVNIQEQGFVLSNIEVHPMVLGKLKCLNEFGNVSIIPNDADVNVSNGTFYFTSDLNLFRHRQETQLFTKLNSHTLCASNNIDDVWTLHKTGGQVVFFKYNENGDLLSSGSGGATWDAITLHSVTFFPDGGGAAAVHVGENFQGTYTVHTWDAQGNFTLLTLGNALGGTKWFLGRDVVADRDNVLYVPAIDNSGQGHNSDIHVFRVNHNDSSIIDNSVVVTGNVWANNPWNTVISKDNKYLYFSANKNTGELFLFQVLLNDLTLKHSANFSTRDTYPSALEAGPNGEVYFGLTNGQVWKFSNNNFLVPQELFISVGLPIVSISVDTFGNVYVMSVNSSTNVTNIDKYNSDGVLQFRITEPTPIGQLSVNPGKLSILS